MKKIALFAIAICLTGLIHASPPMSMLVTNASFTVLPARTTVEATAWASNSTYSQGAYVTGQAHQKYMAIVAGTSSIAVASMPGHAYGVALEGSTTWYKVAPGPRQGYTIYNSSTNVLWLSVGDPAVAGKGWAIAAGASFSTTPNTPASFLNAKLNAIVYDATVNTIAFQEW